jgi:aspartate aminotransferase
MVGFEPLFFNFKYLWKISLSLAMWRTIPDKEVLTRLEVVEEFNKDQREDKTLLSSGYYCDENGNTFILSSVFHAEQQVQAHLLAKIQGETIDHSKEKRNRRATSHSYLSQSGEEIFLSDVSDLIWGTRSSKIIKTMQTPGGTGALRMAAEAIVASHAESGLVLFLR